jgi:large subunit ribosomal protein L17
MRHLKRNAKLGRTGEHRNAMLANMVCSLIRHKRVTTTLAKAKVARPVAEKIVTLGKKNTLHARRLATARLKYADRKMFKTKEENAKFWKNDVIRILFEEIAPAMSSRNGGYTRIVKLGERKGDAAQLAMLEWVDAIAPSDDVVETAPAAKEEKAEAAE